MVKIYVENSKKIRSEKNVVIVEAQSLKIFELLKKLIELNSDQLNGFIKTCVVDANNLIKSYKRKFDYKLTELSELIGDPIGNQIIISSKPSPSITSQRNKTKSEHNKFIKELNNEYSSNSLTMEELEQINPLKMKSVNFTTNFRNPRNDVINKERKKVILLYNYRILDKDSL